MENMDLTCCFALENMVKNMVGVWKTWAVMISTEVA